MNLLVRVKLGYPPEFQLPRQTPSGRKVCEERRKNNAKFSGHYGHNMQRMHYIRTNSWIYSYSILLILVWCFK